MHGPRPSTLRLAYFCRCLKDGTREVIPLSVRRHGPNGPRLLNESHLPDVDFRLSRRTGSVRMSEPRWVGYLLDQEAISSAPPGTVRRDSHFPPDTHSQIAGRPRPHRFGFPRSNVLRAEISFRAATKTLPSCSGDSISPTQTRVLTGAPIRCRPATTKT